MSPAAAATTWRTVYFCVVALRLVAAVFGTSYIHPDEFFQNPEVVAGDVLGIDAHRTWEFDPTFPCRSIVPLYLTTGLPLWLLTAGWMAFGHDRGPPAALIFLAERVSFLVLSFALDFALWRLPFSAPSQKAIFQRLTILASSHVLLTYQLRPFSNSLEAVLLASLLLLLQELKTATAEPVAVQEIKENPSRSLNHRRTSWTLLTTGFGILCALGIFNRITFLAFALPSAIALLGLAHRYSQLGIVHGAQERRSTRLLKMLNSLIPAILSFFLMSLLLSAFDTLYFHPPPSHNLYSPFRLLSHISSHITLTPLNSLLYNSRVENLAQHGLHPQWLHGVVNMPLVCGVAVWVTVLFEGWTIVREVVAGTKGGAATGREPKSKAGSRAEGEEAFISKICLSTIFVGIGLLSTQPHQEPRFLLPLVLPASFLFARSLHRPSAAYTRKMIKRRRAWLASHFLQQALASHFLQQALLALFFGLLHQGGIVPSLLHLNALLLSDPNTTAISSTSTVTTMSDLPFDDDLCLGRRNRVHLITWKTFMTPTHLVVPVGREGNVSTTVLTDLAGASPARVLDTLAEALSTPHSAPIVLLLTPSYARARLGRHVQLPDEGEASKRDGEGEFIYEWKDVGTFGPHVNMDDLAEAFEMGTRGFSLQLGVVRTVNATRAAPPLVGAFA